MLRFLRWAKEHHPNLYPAWLLQGLAGLRGWEAMFLRECDVDWDAKTIEVTETPLHRPKNLYSFRLLPVGETIMREPRWALDQRQGDRHEGCISVNPKGEPWGERERLYGPYDRFEEYLKTGLPEGVERISPKDLRKSFSTLCETELGVSGLALGSYLGHSAQGVRLRHYTDARQIEFLRREVAEKVEEWVRCGGSELFRA
ncbi:hypothetical protein JXA47_00470 [Candidatus Sumerlaeota bacterium]|nr:hypothetical protein [Candidatus Sumerlaeota bacterium]